MKIYYSLNPRKDMFSERKGFFLSLNGKFDGKVWVYYSQRQASFKNNFRDKISALQNFSFSNEIKIFLGKLSSIQN